MQLSLVNCGFVHANVTVRIQKCQWGKFNNGCTCVNKMNAKTKTIATRYAGYLFSLHRLFELFDFIPVVDKSTEHKNFRFVSLNGQVLTSISVEVSLKISHARKKLRHHHVISKVGTPIDRPYLSTNQRARVSSVIVIIKMMIMIIMIMVMIIITIIIFIIMKIIIIIKSIPCRLRQGVGPGLKSLGAGYNKSPRVSDLSFPSSYRDSTSLSIFAVPNNAVFWITPNLTFTPVRFMYSLKLTDTAQRAPITTGITMTFSKRQTFEISPFKSWYFSNFSSSLSFTLSSPGMAASIMTTSLSFLSIKTMPGLLVSIFRSHCVKSHSKFSLSTTRPGFC